MPSIWDFYYLMVAKGQIQPFADPKSVMQTYWIDPADKFITPAPSALGRQDDPEVSNVLKIKLPNLKGDLNEVSRSVGTLADLARAGYECTSRRALSARRLRSGGLSDRVLVRLGFDNVGGTNGLISHGVASFSMRQPVGYPIGSHRGFRTTKTPK
jgi:hypothetical protein